MPVFLLQRYRTFFHGCFFKKEEGKTTALEECFSAQEKLRAHHKCILCAAVQMEVGGQKHAGQEPEPFLLSL